VPLEGDDASDNPALFFKIGHMAKQYEVTLRTLRFYEGIGLLQPKRKGQHGSIAIKIAIVFK
jgi:hypothetical protein